MNLTLPPLSDPSHILQNVSSTEEEEIQTLDIKKVNTTTTPTARASSGELLAYDLNRRGAVVVRSPDALNRPMFMTSGILTNFYNLKPIQHLQMNVNQVVENNGASTEEEESRKRNSDQIDYADLFYSSTAVVPELYKFD